MNKRILIHSLIFSPDGVSTAYLYNDIALKFKAKGYEVVVLTTTPHYNVVKEQLARQPLRWKIWGVCKESYFHGIHVIHIPQKKFKSTLLRLLGFVYWHIVAFLIGLSLRNIKVILFLIISNIIRYKKYIKTLQQICFVLIPLPYLLCRALLLTSSFLVLNLSKASSIVK